MSRYDLSFDDLARLLDDEPSYRVRQLWDGLYQSLDEPATITSLPVAVRRRLAAVRELEPALAVAGTSGADRGETVKWLFSLADGAQVETVLMVHPERATVCVSSQAGCAMGCTFCATGQAGFQRHLSPGEIVEQVVWSSRAARRLGRRLDHVVLMGMGEPLANYDRVLAAVGRIVDGLRIGARRVTLSTVGVVPGIDRLADEPYQVGLAVSLHAANDALRSRLVPLNRRYPIAAVVEACRRYRRATHRRVSFEWALIDGLNDTAADAEELSRLVAPLGAHVNLIPLNPTPGFDLRPSPPARVRSFRDELWALGVNATVRRPRGQTIAAACGQLAGASTAASTGRPVPDLAD